MLSLRGDEIDYPCSDGKPMGETDGHRDLMVELIEALKHYYAKDGNVYVSGNILLYYEEGNVKARVSPDVLVALGRPLGKRKTYKVWEEGKVPDLVVEVTSRKTKNRDQGFKKELYEKLGIREYLQFDPYSEYLRPRFQVCRLENGRFVPVLSPESVGYASPLLGLTFRVVDDELRIFETASGSLLETPQELYQRAQAEAQRAEAEAQRAQAEAQRADAADRKAEEQKQRADRLEKRLRELGLEP